MEVVDTELQKFYQGKYILEIWTRQGEKIFSKVLKEECTQWKVYNNVLVFKMHNDSAQIYVAWLNERKMIAIRHPFDDHKGILKLFQFYIKYKYN